MKRTQDGYLMIVQQALGQWWRFVNWIHPAGKERRWAPYRDDRAGEYGTGATP